MRRKQVLIVGGGDGGMLEEVLKHPVDRAVMVDIDGEIVELCREHLSSICGTAFNDPRTELIIGDGVEFVQTMEHRFDVIIIDSTDPVGPGEGLFSKPFYESCRTALRQDGIIVTQNGVPFFQGHELKKTHRYFAELFEWSGVFMAPVPTYSGGHMAFGWARDNKNLSAIDVATVQSRLDSLTLKTRYYNAEVHVGSFALPNCTRALMS